MRRLEKMILSLICGAAIGLPGCYASDDRNGPGDPPEDAPVDAADDAVEDMIEDVAEEEMPPDEDMYGPPVDFLYGPPWP